VGSPKFQALPVPPRNVRQWSAAHRSTVWLAAKEGWKRRNEKRRNLPSPEVTVVKEEPG